MNNDTDARKVVPREPDAAMERAMEWRDRDALISHLGIFAINADGDERALLRDAIKTIVVLRAENVCDACLGSGKPISGRPCMCGGTGRMSDAARYLRTELTDLRASVQTTLDGQRSLMDQTVRIRRAALGLLEGQPDDNSEGRDTEEIVSELRARAERAEALLDELILCENQRLNHKPSDEWARLAGNKEYGPTRFALAWDAAIRARTQGGDDADR